MPLDPPADPDCPTGCILTFKAEEATAWAAYVAAGKTKAAGLVYLQAMRDAIGRLSDCLDACPSA